MKYFTINWIVLLALLPTFLLAQSKKAKPPVDKTEKLKQEVMAAIDARKDQAQEINDMLFSFSALS